MEEDQAAQLERMKKAQQELQGENDRMLNMIVENPGSQEGYTRQNSEENPLHSPRFTHHHAQTSQGAYMPEMPPVGGDPYTHMPHLVGQLPNNEPGLEANPINSVLMPELNHPKGKEKVNESSLEQANDKELQ